MGFFQTVDPAADSAREQPTYAPVCENCSESCYRAIIYTDGSINCYCESCYGEPGGGKRAACDECGGWSPGVIVFSDGSCTPLCSNCGTPSRDFKMTKYDIVRGATEGEYRFSRS